MTTPTPCPVDIGHRENENFSPENGPVRMFNDARNKTETAVVLSTPSETRCKTTPYAGDSLGSPAALSETAVLQTETDTFARVSWFDSAAPVFTMTDEPEEHGFLTLAALLDDDVIIGVENALHPVHNGVAAIIERFETALFDDEEPGYLALAAWLGARGGDDEPGDGAEPADDGELVDFSLFDVPGADPDDAQPPFVIESTPEQVEQATAFFVRAKSQETKAQKERASKQSGVMSILQYRSHPDTGEVMLTQQQIDAALEVLRPRIKKFAYIWHPCDRVVEVDEGTGEPFCVGIKGTHAHLVLWFTDRPTIRSVSDAFKIPSPRVKAPKDAEDRGGHAHAGRNAAEKAFFDLCEYLPHETRGSAGVRGVNIPQRFYCVDTNQPGHPGKYQYGRGRVVANFNFGVELDAHMLGRVHASEGSNGMRQRKDRLRTAVMDGATLAEVRKADKLAYADDLPRLKQLAADYNEITANERAADIGTMWRKSLVLVTGPTRNGKDELGARLAKTFIEFGALAGRTWSATRPAGSHAGEALELHEVAHHEDARFTMLARYDEVLRYFDPNRSTPMSGRNFNRGAPVQRLTIVTTSEPYDSFAVTLRARRSTDELAQREQDAHERDGRSRGRVSKLKPYDVDEFLFRIGWHASVLAPYPARDDMTDEQFAAWRSAVVVTISRVNNGDAAKRVQPVHGGDGHLVGSISTAHRLDQVAVIRGLDEAARFLAVSILFERNPDVVDDIPDDARHALIEGKVVIESQAQAEAVERAEKARTAHMVRIAGQFSDEARARQAQAERTAELRAREEREARKRAELAEQGRQCPCPKGYSWSPGPAQVHTDVTCPFLSDAERQQLREKETGRHQAHD